MATLYVAGALSPNESSQTLAEHPTSSETGQQCLDVAGRWSVSPTASNFSTSVLTLADDKHGSVLTLAEDKTSSTELFTVSTYLKHENHHQATRKLTEKAGRVGRAR
jgi:VCBS repeat-containing protein